MSTDLRQRPTTQALVNCLVCRLRKQRLAVLAQVPAFVRLGKAIRYDEGDLARFIAQGRAAK